MKKKIFFENLDGLRFLCFLSVFLYHSFHTDIQEIKDVFLYHFLKKELFGNGNIGVNFFFVLSGFLITYLLIEEKKLNGQVSIPKFWLRRILRIWPLFFFCVFFGFVVFPYIKQLMGQVSTETADPIFYFTFLNNFDFISKGLPDSSVLGVLWSVAIEEQFYFLWPVIIFLFPLKKLWIPFSIIIITSLIYRTIFNDPFLHEYHTLSCIGDMTIGAVGAWLVIFNMRFQHIIIHLKRYYIIIFYLCFIVIFIFRDELLLQNSTIRIFERLLIAIVILFIILEQTYSKNSVFKMSNFKSISNLGKITYGLYCLHFIGILIILNLTKLFHFNTELWQIILIETILSLLLTIIISKFSFRFFETPFLKFKDRFSFITK